MGSKLRTLTLTEAFIIILLYKIPNFDIKIMSNLFFQRPFLFTLPVFKFFFSNALFNVIYAPADFIGYSGKLDFLLYVYSITSNCLIESGVHRLKTKAFMYNIL